MQRRMESRLDMESKLPARLRRSAAAAVCFAGLMPALSPATAQDIRGMEVCTAEKQMDRRTACLQANVEFLERALTKMSRETDDKIAAARAEIAVLEATIEKLRNELAQMKTKAEPGGKK
jgi:folate-dependent phosphoribosylglycinamide formyltransferase PurN